MDFAIELEVCHHIGLPDQIGDPPVVQLELELVLLVLVVDWSYLEVIGEVVEQQGKHFWVSVQKD